ncbi:MAG: response regulator [Candidatus Zixiibacteriota bacterium]
MIAKKKARILVVDDDLNLLNLLTDTLEAIGYHPASAPGGAEAMERLNREKYDLLITDIKMPDIDGIQLLKKVRRYFPDLPVLFITGVAEPEIIGRALPDGVLAKPFRINHIEELIENTLNRSLEEIGNPIRKVLVVENEDKYRKQLMDTLNYCYYIPFSVSGGREALIEIENGKFDVVIAGAKLTDMDSRTLVNEVKLKHPELPVIISDTERSGKPETYNHSDFQVDGYLKKPFETADIINLFNQLSSPKPNL